MFTPQTTVMNTLVKECHSNAVKEIYGSKYDTQVQWAEPCNSIGICYGSTMTRLQFAGILGLRITLMLTT